MSHLVHLVRADLRRAWLPLSAWLALAIVAAVLPCALPMVAANDTRILRALEAPMVLVMVAYPLLMAVFIVQVVQTHKVVGSDAFWMTRPISPLTLLMSKAVLLGAAVILVPVAIEGIRMSAHGVPWSTQGAVALRTAAMHALLLGPIMLGAAITASFSRFALLVSGLVAAFAVFMAVVIAVDSRSGSAPSYEGWSALPDPTSEYVDLLLTLAAIAAAIALQYRLRSRPKTLTVAIAGCAVASAVGSMAMPWSVLRPAEQLPAWAHDPSALRVGVADTSTMESFASAGLRDEDWIGVRGALDVAGIDPAFTVRAGVADASLSIEGDTLTSVRELYPVTLGGDEQQVHPWGVHVPRAVLDVDRLLGEPRGRPEMPTLFFAGAAEVQRHAPASGRYQGRVRMVLQRHEVEGVLPLSVGRIHHNGPYRLAIGAIDRRLGHVSLRAHESRAGSAFERALHPHYSYFLRNQRLREAVRGTGDPVGGPSAFGFLSYPDSDQWDGFVVREMLFRFSDAEERRSIVIDAAWLADAELVIVATRRAGVVERDLSIADFPIVLPSRAGF